MNQEIYHKRIQELTELAKKCDSKELEYKLINAFNTVKQSIYFKHKISYFIIRSLQINIDLYKYDAFAYTDNESITLCPLFAYLDLHEQVCVLVHEVYHILNKHFSRLPVLRSLYNNDLIINLALDVVINREIRRELGTYDILYYAEDMLEQQFKIIINNHMSAEDILSLIRDKQNTQSTKREIQNFNIDKLYKNNTDSNKSIQEKSYTDIDVLIRRAKLLTQGTNKTTTQKNVSIDTRYHNKIKFIQLLKNELLSQEIQYQTWSRINKFFVDKKGNVYEYQQITIHVIVDTSGSMNEYLTEVFTQIYYLCKHDKIILYTVDIDLIGHYAIKSISDINKIKINLNAGTRFSNALNKISKYITKNDIIILISDFEITDYNSALKIFKNIKCLKKIAINEKYEINKEWSS